MIGIEQVFSSTRPGRGSIVYNSEEIDFRPFAFVLNVKRLIPDSPIELAPGYTLRRAQESEIQYIKEFITKELKERRVRRFGKLARPHRASSPNFPRRSGDIS